MSNLPITAFDIAVGAILLISALLSLSRGLVREVMSLLSWVGAAAVAWFVYPELKPIVMEAVGHDLLSDVIAALAAFLLPLILFKIVGGLLVSRTQDSSLGGIDSALGLAFGLGRGVLIVCVAYLLASMLIDPRQFPGWVTEARTEPPVRVGAQWLGGFLPANVDEVGREAVGTALERARERRSADTPDAAPGQDAGYGQDEREKLDRLFESIR